MKASGFAHSFGDDQSDTLQAGFDLQCFKEFVRSFRSIQSWSSGVLKYSTDKTPWAAFEDESGITLPYAIQGRRVGKFNLQSLALGSVKKSALVDAFGDVCETDERPSVMVFKFAGVPQQGIAGTKLAYIQCEPSTPLPEYSGIYVPGHLDIPPGFIMRYKDWLGDIHDTCRYIFE